MILSRWKLLAAIVVACTLFAFAFSAFYLAQKPVYEAAARVNVAPTSEELGYASRFVRGSNFEGSAPLIQTYGEYVTARPTVAAVVDRLIAREAARAGQSPAQWIASRPAPGWTPGRILALLNYGSAPPLPPREDLIAEVTESTTVEVIEGTFLLRLTVGWDDPEVAAWLANELVSDLIRDARNAARASGEQLDARLGEGLDTLQAQLAAKQDQSRRLKASLGVVDIDRQKQVLLEGRIAEQTKLTDDQAQIGASARQVAALQAGTGGKLSAAQVQVEQTLALERPRLAGLRQGTAVRQARIAQMGQQIAALSAREIAVKRLDDEIGALQAQVRSLTERLSFTALENVANAPSIRLVEAAVPPTNRTSPKIFFNTALGGIAGCALAGMALLLVGPAPRRFVDDPAPEPIIEADRLQIARPVDGANYSAAERTALADPIVDWLGRPLTDPARNLAVMAAGTDADAAMIFRLLRTIFDSRGETVAPVDAVDGRLPAAEGGTRRLIYAGGLAQRGRVDVADADTDVVLVVADGDSIDPWSARIAESTGSPPHVLVVAG